MSFRHYAPSEDPHLLKARIIALVLGGAYPLPRVRASASSGDVCAPHAVPRPRTATTGPVRGEAPTPTPHSAGCLGANHLVRPPLRSRCPGSSLRQAGCESVSSCALLWTRMYRPPSSLAAHPDVGRNCSRDSSQRRLACGVQSNSGMGMRSGCWLGLGRRGMGENVVADPCLRGEAAVRPLGTPPERLQYLNKCGPDQTVRPSGLDGGPSHEAPGAHAVLWQCYSDIDAICFRLFVFLTRPFSTSRGTSAPTRDLILLQRHIKRHAVEVSRRVECRRTCTIGAPGSVGRHRSRFRHSHQTKVPPPARSGNLVRCLSSQGVACCTCANAQSCFMRGAALIPRQTELTFPFRTQSRPGSHVSGVYSIQCVSMLSLSQSRECGLSPTRGPTRTSVDPLQWHA